MSAPRYFIKDDAAGTINVHAKWNNEELIDRRFKFGYDSNDDVIKIKISDSTDTETKLLGDGYTEIYQTDFDNIIDAVDEFRTGHVPVKPS